MRVFAILALLLGLAGLIAAQTCAGAGYDVSSAAVDMTLVSGSYTWYLHPCGSISANTNAGCANVTSHPNGAMLCQVPTGSNTTQYIASSYTTATASSVQWLAITNGVQMSLQDGDGCGIGAPRETTVQFICDQSASTPVFSSIAEVEVCWYTAVVRTSAACTTTGSTASHGVGSSYLDSVCGGELYDLSAIHNYGDMRFDSNTSSPTLGFNYWLNMCGTVQQANCSSLQPTSFCQTSKSSGDPVASLANINSTTQAIYTVNSDGVTMAIQDGTPCGAIGVGGVAVPRQASIRVICDNSNPPTLVSVAENETCHYAAVVRGTCGAYTAGSTGGSPQPPPGNSATSATASFVLVALVAALMAVVL